MGRASVLTVAGERAAWSAAGLLVFVTGYFGIGGMTRPARCHDLGTALDARIPFVPGTVWLYLAVFPLAFAPLFIVRCPALVRRTMAAYAVTFGLSLLMFAALPVGSATLRATPPADRTATSRALSRLYAIDPPSNLFPSLHLSIAILAGASAWKARRAYGAPILAGIAPLAVSILTVKQHFVADAVGGLLLAAIVYALILRPYRPADGVDPAFGRAGPATFVALTVAGYTTLYAAFALGA